MSRKSATKICPVCENGYLWGNQTQCNICDERDEREALESRHDVIALNQVENLDELKEWIKEHLIK